MQEKFQKILIIQTAFIGDVILSTALIEKLVRFYPQAEIDFLLRKGNEGVLQNHPHIKNLIIWDKKGGKYKNLLNLLVLARKRRYDLTINLQRFATTGLFTSLSGAKTTIGFDKNPFSFLFDKKVKHQIGEKHEVERNLELIKDITDGQFIKPKIYPSESDFEKVSPFKTQKYICIAPGSVWFTKQFPGEKWVEFVNLIPGDFKIYLIGGPGDIEISRQIMENVSTKSIESLVGKLSLLQSAALMKDAEMNYVNDSGPMHLASAMNAKTTAIYCSTVPEFGFGPLSDESKIIQTDMELACKPCGLHGYQKCPLMHFNCALTINVNKLVRRLDKEENEVL
jgi:heptosyltransferase II